MKNITYLVESGIHRIDMLIDSHIYKGELGGMGATSNSGVQHDTEGAPFALKAYAWADCTCEYSEEYWTCPTKGGEECGDCRDCEPNFSHHASGLKCWWHKHLRRSNEQNKDVSDREWLEIERECFDWILSQEPRSYWEE